VIGNQDAPGVAPPRVRMTRPRALIERLRPVIERNRWFSLALLAGFFLRLLAMIGYPGALWFSGDSYVYIGAALRPVPDASKTTGYALFLRLLLPFHSFTLVTLIQHMMGLAVAVMIYALLRRAGVSRMWATIATLPQLLDGFIIEDEHMIMGETVLTFCLMLATLLVLWKPRTRWWVALIAGLLVGYQCIEGTEGMAMLAVFPAFMLIRSLRTYGWRKLQGWLVTVVVSIGCLIPVVSYLVWFHSDTGAWNLSNAEGFYVWGRVSSFANCAEIKAPADVMKYCPTEPFKDRTPPGYFIWYVPQLHQDMNSVGGPVSVKGNKLLTEFDIDAIESQPLGYVKSVAKGVLMSLDWPMKNYPDAGTVYYYDFHLHYVTSKYNELPPKTENWIPARDVPPSELVPKYSAYDDWVNYGHQDPGVVVKPVAVLILGYERIFNTLGPLFGIIMVIGLGGVVTIERRPWRLRWRRRQGSMFPWVTAVVLLVFPIATADFDFRYLLPVIPFACLAAGLSFAPVRAKLVPSTQGTGTTEQTEAATGRAGRP
jgi:hypothetical protein